MPDFHVVSDYSPSGDQPEAIDALASGLEAGLDEQTLLAVLSVVKKAISGKTALFVSHNPEDLGLPTLLLPGIRPAFQGGQG